MAVVVLMRLSACKQVLVAALLAAALLSGLPAAAAGGGLMDQFERSVGAGAVPELVKAYGGEYHPSIWERQWVDEVFQRLVDVSSRKHAIEYSLTVLNSMELNAFALPGGFVFITRGMLRDLKGDQDRLAAVLGHEIAHVELKHGINSVLRQLGMTVLVEVGMIWLDLGNAEVVRVASQTLLQVLRLGWGREAEYEADLLGQKLAAAAGFDPAGAVMLVDYLLSIESTERSTDIFSTHPPSKARRERVLQELANFWGEPVKLGETDVREVLDDGRRCASEPRKDVMGRFTAELRPGANGDTVLVVHDAQLEEERQWLGNLPARAAEWSPTGEYLAVVVDTEDGQAVWLLDRFGRVAHQWRQYEGARVALLEWDPAGRRLAYVVDDGQLSQLLVGYIPGQVSVVIQAGTSFADLCWVEDGSSVAYSDGSDWYVVHGPRTQSVVLANPVPQVVERRSFLAPTVESDGETIRLTRPQLAWP